MLTWSPTATGDRWLVIVWCPYQGSNGTAELPFGRSLCVVRDHSFDCLDSNLLWGKATDDNLWWRPKVLRNWQGAAMMNSGPLSEDN